jgi:hypothetical protein
LTWTAAGSKVLRDVRVLNSVLIGMVAALAAVILWLLAKTVLSVSVGEGVGAVGFVISDFEIVLAAIAGYCAGFFWRQRRSRP